MSDPRADSPVERFLDAQAAAGGPFALLGVSPSACDEQRILSSLQRQLDRVAQHPEGDTPEGDQVRLALHTAAAQLLDPSVLAAMRERYAGAPPARHTAPSTPPLSGGLDEDASRILARFGGWNERSLRQLAAIAQARGVSSGAAADSLRTLAASGHAAPMPTHTPEQQATAPPRPGEAAREAAAATALTARERRNRAEAARVRRDAAIVVSLLLAGFVALASLGGYLIVRSLSPRPAAAPVATSPGAAGESATAPSPPAPSAPPTAATGTGLSFPRAEPAATATTPFRDPVVLLRDLRAAAAKAKADGPAGLADAEPLIFTLSEWWCRYDAAQRRALDDAVLELVYACARWPEPSERVIEFIARGSGSLRPRPQAAAPSEIWPASWSLGALARLSRERDLPRTVSVRVERGLLDSLGAAREAAGSSFESGATAALRRLAPRLISALPAGDPGELRQRTAGAVRKWLDAVAAVSPSDEARERLMVDGLENLLIAGPNPDQRLDAFEAIATIGAETSWRPGGPARPRLMEWFRDPRIDNAAIRVLTSAIATRSSAPGVDQTMILSAGAGPDDRARLRLAYARAWGLEGAGARDSAAASWLAAAQSALAAPAPEGPEEALIRAVRLAWLNHAATSLWRGDVDRATSIAATDPLPPGVPPPSGQQVIHIDMRTGLFTTESGDGLWAARFLGADRNIAQRLERLRELDQGHTVLLAIDAEVLVEAAMGGSPASVWGLARSIVQRRASEGRVAAALLEVLPRAPRTESVSDLIQRAARRPLPRAGDPAWPAAARRALVERMLELLAGQGEPGTVDAAAGKLAEAYLGIAGEESAGPSPGPAAIAESLLHAAEVIFRFNRAEAERLSPSESAPIRLDEIDRRFAGRASLAIGPVQAFVAVQAASAEAFAYVVAAERPSAAGGAAEAVNDLAQARRDARHIFEQVHAAEHAVLRLWTLRLQENTR